MRAILLIVALTFSVPAYSQAGPTGIAGRFVIVHSPHIQSDTVLLDTATGKTWQQVQDSSRSAVYWEPMARADVPAEIQEWLAANPKSEAPK